MMTVAMPQMMPNIVSTVRPRLTARFANACLMIVISPDIYCFLSATMGSSCAAWLAG